MEELAILLESMKDRIRKVKDLEKAEKIRVELFGKNGIVTARFKDIGKISPERRAEFGKKMNEIKSETEAFLLEKIRELKAQDTENKALERSVDLTLPGPARSLGRLHLITQVINECVDVFSKMGFEVVEGPEIETAYYNFEALNTPEWHPARDLHDTFYLRDGRLLRTQTSPVQVRTMERREPPLRIVSPGRVYRMDYDATHLPAFFQIEGLAVDRKLSLADLKGTLEVVIKTLLGDDKIVRFRPHYFPFTEPSIEVDISFEEGKTNWLEVAGAGMVHPAVLKNVGIDPEEFHGFAFGMGIERIAMLKYGVDDIREFPKNSLNFLRLF